MPNPVGGPLKDLPPNAVFEIKHAVVPQFGSAAVRAIVESRCHPNREDAGASFEKIDVRLRVIVDSQPRNVPRSLTVSAARRPRQTAFERPNEFPHVSTLQSLASTEPLDQRFIDFARNSAHACSSCDPADGESGSVVFPASQALADSFADGGRDKYNRQRYDLTAFFQKSRNLIRRLSVSDP